MARHYKTRTKSTNVKTYQDYLNMRHDLERKGYVLKEQLSRTSFEEYYKRLREAKKANEISSQPWQVLKSKETYLSSGQAKSLSIASKAMKEQGLATVSFTASQIKKMATSQTIYYIGLFLNEHKDELFSGRYE